VIGLLSLLTAAALAPAPAQPAPAPAPALSAAAKKDVQCFILYAVAVERAVADKDDKTKDGATLGVMYFFAKLKVEAPGLNLSDAVHQQADSFGTEAQAKAIGDSCDSEFQTGGAELRDLGQKLQQSEAKPPAQ
jgi:hypothetical protein